MLNLTYSYRIYPGLDQEQMMLNWLEQCRRVYNYALAERKDWINSRKCAVNACGIKQEYIIPADTPYPDYYKQQNALTKAKELISELKAVHSQVLQDALKRLDKSFKFMQERGFRFPRFKKFGQYRSFVFPQFKSDPVNGFEIKLPKIGSMPINLHRPIPAGFEVKQVRVVKKASGWYAQLILQSDVSVPEPMPHGQPIGIDLGLEKFLAVSTGELVERPRFFMDLQSKLKWLQRKLRNKKKGSANYRKAQAKIRALHEHIHDVRREFHFLSAHRLCDIAGMIFAEDLNLKMTSRGMLAKHCLDAAWGSFLDILKWVAWKRGVHFALVDPNGTSQTCPQCGAHTGKKELKCRVHHCDECGYETDRDVAAAQVVEQRGLVAVGQTVILPVEEGCLGTPREAGKPNREEGEARAIPERVNVGRMSRVGPNADFWSNLGLVIPLKTVEERNLERTFLMVKPDGVQRGLVGEVIKRLETKGFTLVGMKLLNVSRELAEQHYAVHKERPFFPGLIEFITSGPVVATVWEGEGVIASARKIIGATKPLDAEPGTIRGDYGVSVGRNLIHGSDAPETAQYEVGLWFKEEELVNWQPTLTPWLYE